MVRTGRLLARILELSAEVYGLDVPKVRWQVVLGQHRFLRVAGGGQLPSL